MVAVTIDTTTASVVDNTKPKLVNKNRADNRIFVLKPMEGKFDLAKAGTADSRLYKGGNYLYAKKTPEGYWVLRLEHGTVPQAFEQLFTRFDRCEQFVREYYSKKNIELVEVKD